MRRYDQGATDPKRKFLKYTIEHRQCIGIQNHGSHGRQHCFNVAPGAGAKPKTRPNKNAFWRGSLNPSKNSSEPSQSNASTPGIAVRKIPASCAGAAMVSKPARAQRAAWAAN